MIAIFGNSDRQYPRRFGDLFLSGNAEVRDDGFSEDLPERTDFTCLRFMGGNHSMSRAGRRVSFRRVFLNRTSLAVKAEFNLQMQQNSD